MGVGCNVLHTPKVLSSRTRKFNLHGPQVRTVWISYWILNTGYQIRNHSSFVHCLKINKFNTISNQNWMYFHPPAVDPQQMTYCVYRSPYECSRSHTGQTGASSCLWSKWVSAGTGNNCPRNGMAHKMQRISWQADKLLASQAWLGCMKLRWLCSTARCWT